VGLSGPQEGDWVGEIEGPIVGELILGDADGVMLGKCVNVGELEGLVVGDPVGCGVTGDDVGKNDGNLVIVGAIVGFTEGLVEGLVDGKTVGDCDGAQVTLQHVAAHICLIISSVAASPGQHTFR
jgi:hypothetical protein